MDNSILKALQTLFFYKVSVTYLMVRYMGLMMNSGKVCILIMMIMNTAYKTTLTNPAKEVTL